MKIMDIVGRVGGAVFKEIIPGGGLIVGILNELLPEDKKLSSKATGLDIAEAIELLPADQRAHMLVREFDVDVTRIQENNATIRAMLEAEVKAPHTTRPYIAKGAFQVVAFVTVTVITLWAYGAAIRDGSLVAVVADGWQFVLAVLAPLVTLLWAYFGVLKQEQLNRFNAATGSTSGGLSGIIKDLLKRR